MKENAEAFWIIMLRKILYLQSKINFYIYSACNNL
jgi:hypothetical protein